MSSRFSSNFEASILIYFNVCFIINFILFVCKLFILYVCVTQRFELFKRKALYKYLLLLLYYSLNVNAFFYEIEQYWTLLVINNDTTTTCQWLYSKELQSSCTYYCNLSPSVLARATACSECLDFTCKHHYQTR